MSAHNESHAESGIRALPTSLDSSFGAKLAATKIKDVAKLVNRVEFFLGFLYLFLCVCGFVAVAIVFCEIFW